MRPKNLMPRAFSMLTTKEITPRGWLRDQLIIQARGLSGNLHKIWPDVRDSKWIGGDREGWERVPYWLDGFIPLAYLLKDEALIADARRYIDAILDGQRADGWICPCQDSERGGYDMWALFLIGKVLVVYHDCSGDPRVEEALHLAYRNLNRHIDQHPLFGWAQMRWYEAFISLEWLYRRRPEPWIHHLMTKISAMGFDYARMFKDWPYEKPQEQGIWSHMSHVVNNAMMLKCGAMEYLITGECARLSDADLFLEKLDAFHGMVTGAFTGDECLAGQSPVQGTELCAVAEMMYSMEQLLSVDGDARYGDRLERLAYNALPATFTPDMWAHQYDQQVNQPAAQRQENPVFLTNSGESNLFGLEPNYGCCTANLSQPWPKFALSTIMTYPDGAREAVGAAVTAYAPVEARFLAAGDVPVCITLDTEYPFREEVKLSVCILPGTYFELKLRIPDFAEGAALITEEDERIPLTPGTYYTLARVWDAAHTTLTLRFPMVAAFEKRPGGLVALKRGPLVYSLKIGERLEMLEYEKDGVPRLYPYCDYEVLPTTPWNYGFACESDEIVFEERPLGSMPFSPEGAPVVARAMGRRVPWAFEDGRCAPAPEGYGADSCGAPSSKPNPGGAIPANPLPDAEPIVLIPYGATNIRMTELPKVDIGRKQSL